MLFFQKNIDHTGQKSTLGKKTVLMAAVSVILSGGQLVYAGDAALPDTGAVPQQAKFVPNQLIVGIMKVEGMTISSVVANIQNVAAQNGGKQLDEMPDTAVLLSFPSDGEALQATEALKKLPGVKFVERNGIMSIPPTPPAFPNKQNPSSGTSSSSSKAAAPVINSVSADPSTGYQWHHTVVRKTAAMGTLVATPPTVAVLDTGVDYTHPDLSGKVILGKDFIDGDMDPFDDNSHGTHVAGLIAAKSGNGQYGEGICGNCKILAVKVLDAYGSGSDWSVAQGMAYARTYVATPAVKVINMSLGGGFSQLIADQVLALKNAGKVLVAAAGNGNTSVPSYPGGDPNTALRVMATNQSDCRTYFSNFSPTATPTLYNIAAPGWEIPSTVPGGGFASYSGTSMASPIVAGGAALLWGQVPALTRDQLISRLVNNGQPISCGFVVTTKRLDVRKAVTLTAETAVIGQALDPWISLAPSSSVTNTLKIFNGTTLVASDAANQAGSYEVPLPAATGTRTLAATRTDYSAATLRSASVVAGAVAGPYIDGMIRNRGTGTANISIDWKTVQPKYVTSDFPVGKTGWEFDSYIKTPSGGYVYWANPGSLLELPYVGLGVDSYHTLNPVESMAIMGAATNGVYTVIINNAAGTTAWNPAWAGSGASVQIAFAGALKASVAPPASGTCATAGNVWWTVGKISKSGTAYTWTLVNTCSSTIP